MLKNPCVLIIVNSEFFMSILFPRNFANVKFGENKPSHNGCIILYFTDIINCALNSNFLRRKYVLMLFTKRKF